MDGSLTINQDNVHGNNNLTIKLAQDAFRPYDKVLSVGEEKKFLDDASENLIRDRKLHLNQNYINQVKQYLEDRKFCLIKAPEGRGKTCLSRIIAYDYHNIKGMEVYFLDFKDYNDITVSSIDDALQEWHKDSQKQYLLVIENVHAYKDVDVLRKCINGWINSNGNCFWFLLNTRPTDDDLDEFSDWEEIVELNPNKDDVDGIINLFFKEVGREPFANDEQRDSFVEKIYPNKKKASGANLRLLKIYLETWQHHDEIQYISSVSEQTVIEEFRRLYLKHKTKKKNEIEALWYISSLFQFDVPLHEDFVPDVGNLVEDGLLRFEENKYYLPHSVDATFLFKAICDYKGKNYAAQMKTFTIRFLDNILSYNCPKDYVRDFRLLYVGLFTRKEEFEEVYYNLTREELAKEIITKLDPGFVLKFFRPNNHVQPNPEALIDYYQNNTDWLKPIFQGLSPYPLNIINRLFKNHLSFDNLIKDIFEDSKNLDYYLSASQNYYVFVQTDLFTDIIYLGDEYKKTLLKHYEINKDRLKPILLGFSPTRLVFIFKTIKKHLEINILKDIFEDTKDLDNYLNASQNSKGFVYLLIPIINLGDRHKAILVEHYEKNKDLLKPFLRVSSLTTLVFNYKEFKKKLNINLFKDIFEDSKSLDDFLNANQNYKALSDNSLLISFSKLGARHRTILIKQYEKNKDKLKSILLGYSPTSLVFTYKVYRNHLNINIVKDLFTDLDALVDYLKKHDIRAFLQDDVLKAIQRLGFEHQQLLNKYSAFDHFFYPTRATKNSFRIGPQYIDQFWSKKQTFDVCQIKDNRFCLDGVSWVYLHKFVAIIKNSMTEDNRQQSISMVKSIIRMVLAKENALSYATSVDLGYFYFNIASIEETLFQDLKENIIVRQDIERRLETYPYNVRDLSLFGFFFDQPWCKAKLEPRIINADEAQQKIINEWHDEVLKRLADRGDEITPGSLLDYIHHNTGLVNPLPENASEQHFP